MIQNIMLQFNFFTAQNDNFLCLEPESKPPILSGARAGAGAHPIGSEAVPGPWASGARAAQKSGYKYIFSILFYF